MPRWGLTREQRLAQPWGIPSGLLEADKTITNSIEGDVYATRLERLFIDTPSVQRLRRVRQLGMTRAVYPDGDHSRFSHVLGAMQTAQGLLDYALQQNTRRRPQHDLFSEWWDEFGLADRNEFERRIAEATVLARLGALLHDVGHVPFSHTIEDELNLLPRHDKSPERFERFWNEMLTSIQDTLALEAEVDAGQACMSALNGRLRPEIERLVLSGLDTPPSGGWGWTSDYPFVQDIVGNTICADLLDYLARDHQNMGLPFALGHRFLDGLFVTASTHPHRQRRVAIEIERNGIERRDVISELLKCLRFRYEESERALNHHAKLAADAMIGKLLAMWRDALWIEAAADLAGNPVPQSVQADIDKVRKWLESDVPDTVLAETLAEAGSPSALDPEPAALHRRVVDHVDTVVSAQVEAIFSEFGDDGLLEHLRRDNRDRDDKRRRAVADLADSVLNRRLFKMIGQSLPEDRSFAETLWDRFQDIDERRRFEIEATDYVGVADGWHLVLWVPNPKMKLKQAFVLVGTDGHVTTLHDHSERVQEIYRSHEALWCTSVFVHPSLARDDLRREVLLAWLAEHMGLRGWQGAPGRHELRLQKEHVAVEHFVRERNLDAATRERLLASTSSLDPQASGTLADLQTHLNLIVETLGLAGSPAPKD